MGTLGEATAQRLEAAMAKLITTVESLDEATVHQLPGEREWSAMETLAHVAELVPFWAHRARQVAEGTLFMQRLSSINDIPDLAARVLLTSRLRALLLHRARTC